MAERFLKLEASAGSGKTFLLTLEYLTRLFGLTPDRPVSSEEEYELLRQRVGSILAITFTNKAAGEMKTRILSNLKRFAMAHRGTPLTPEASQMLRLLSEKSGKSEDALLAGAGRLADIILSGYDDFHVRTIDSLMSNIITVISPDLDLPADFRIHVDAEATLRESIGEFLAIEASNEWPRLEAFLQEYASLQRIRKWNLHEDIASTLYRLFQLFLHRHSLSAKTAENHLKLQNRWNDIRQAARPRLRELLSLVCDDSSGGPRSKHVNGTQFSAKRLQALEAFTEKSEDRELPCLSFLASREADALLSKKCPDEFRFRFAQCLDNVKKHLEELFGTLSQYRIMRFLDIMDRFDKHWTRNRHGIFVEEFSRTLFGRIQEWESYAYPYLYLKLSDRFFHFLFDEFQDTSELQFKALAPIVDEVLSSQKKATLFIVGDRKQAIYRWRGGNAHLMDEEVLKREIHSLQNVPSEAFSRSQQENWRSGSAIVGFLNDFWNPEAISEAVVPASVKEAVARNFSHSVQVIPKQRRQKEGYVCVDVWSKKDEDEDEESEKSEENSLLFARILAHINACIDAGFGTGDLAILTRKNEECRKLLSFLNDNRISAVSDESLLLGVNPLAAEIVAFFRFLDYPPDNLSFFTFVNGEIFRNRVQRGSFPNKPVFDPPHDATGINGIFYMRFRERFPDIWQELLEPFFQSAGFLAPYDIFSDFTMRFRLFEHFSDDSAFFISFADTLHCLENEHILSIAAFLEKWPEIEKGKEAMPVPSPVYSSAIRIMTIHQAKGLGFPVVILPLFSTRSRQENRFLQGNDRLYWINAEYREGSRELQDIYNANAIQEQLDELNLLYVAMTRAEQALFITGHSTPPHLFFCHPLFARDPASPVFLQQGTLSAQQKMEAAAASLPVVLPIPAKKIATAFWHREYLVFRTKKRESEEDRMAARRGDAIHRTLARLHIYPTTIALQEEISAFGREERLEAKDTALLGHYLSRPEIFRFFSGPVDVFTEKEWCRLQRGEAETRRVDRLVVGEGISVVEFKTGKHRSPDYVPQVSEYLEIISLLFPGKKANGYILYLDLEEMEKVGC